jgi:hypothetical protein
VWHALEHENILPLLGITYEFGRDKPMGMVCPWLDNGNLNSYLDKHGAMPPSVVLLFRCSRWLSSLGVCFISYLDELAPFTFCCRRSFVSPRFPNFVIYLSTTVQVVIALHLHQPLLWSFTASASSPIVLLSAIAPTPKFCYAKNVVKYSFFQTSY